MKGISLHISSQTYFYLYGTSNFHVQELSIFSLLFLDLHSVPIFWPYTQMEKASKLKCLMIEENQNKQTSVKETLWK